MPKPNDDAIEKKLLTIVYLVFHPKAGLICTELYPDKATERAEQLLELHGGECFVIRTGRIVRTTCAESRQVFKIEKNRLYIEQETL